MRTKRDHSIDALVGASVRKRRIELGMNQQMLGAALNLSYQQIQKYERGTNRITAGVLWILSEALNVDVAYFFEAIGAVPVKPSTDMRGARSNSSAATSMPSDRETLELIKGYKALPDRTIRKSVRSMIAALAKSERDTDQRDRHSTKGRSAGR